MSSTTIITYPVPPVYSNMFDLTAAPSLCFTARMGDITTIKDDRKTEFLRQMLANPQEYVAARAANVPISLVRVWLDEDPDFNLAVDEIKMHVLDTIEAKGINLALDGSEQMVKFFLERLRPDQYSLTQREQQEKIVHRFFDFGGGEIHNPEDDDAIEGEVVASGES